MTAEMTSIFICNTERAICQCGGIAVALCDGYCIPCDAPICADCRHTIASNKRGQTDEPIDLCDLCFELWARVAEQRHARMALDRSRRPTKPRKPRRHLRLVKGRLR